MGRFCACSAGGEPGTCAGSYTEAPPALRDALGSQGPCFLPCSLEIQCFRQLPPPVQSQSSVPPHAYWAKRERKVSEKAEDTPTPSGPRGPVRSSSAPSPARRVFACILGPRVPATTITAIEMPPATEAGPGAGPGREERKKKEIECSPQTLQCQEPFFSILCVERGVSPGACTAGAG